MSSRPFGMSHLVRSTGEQAGSNDLQYDPELQLNTSADGIPLVAQPGALAAERCHPGDGNDDANATLA